MPTGQYPRTKRGSYKEKRAVPTEELIIKRALYFSNKQYWTLQVEAAKRNLPVSVLIREIVDDFLFKNNIEIIIQKPQD